jgi:hypothetical protein
VQLHGVNRQKGIPAMGYYQSKNKKGYIAIITISAVVIMVLVLIVSSGKHAEEESIPVEIPMTADWLELEGGDNEISIIDHSSLIIRGYVESSSVEQIQSALFTHFSVRVEEVYAYNTDDAELITNDLDSNAPIIDVRLTGGKKSGQTLEFADSPLLNLDEEYVLFLEKKPEYSYYMPIGERFGIAKINDDGILRFTNDEAKVLCKDFEGKNIQDIIKSLHKVESKIDDAISINSEESPPEEVIE